MNKYPYRLFWLMNAMVFMLVALPVQRAQAATATELFFSEYLEGSSNNKAVSSARERHGNRVQRANRNHECFYPVTLLKRQSVAHSH